jgi:hypothetical protein
MGIQINSSENSAYSLETILLKNEKIYLDLNSLLQDEVIFGKKKDFILNLEKGVYEIRAVVEGHFKKKMSPKL